MKHFRTFAAAVLLAVVCTALAQNSDSRARDSVVYYPPQPGENEFAVKSEYIRKLVMSYVNAKIDISDPSVKMEIRAEIGKNMTLESKIPADSRTDAMIAAGVDKDLRKKYTKDPQEYRKELEAQAEKKFRLYRFGEKVTVRYRAGNGIRSVTGKFGQFNGGGITIGYRHIPFCDLLEEDKAHVNEAYAEAAKRKYVQSAVDTYVGLRQSDRFSRISLIKKQIATQNRKNGYLYLDKQWVSPGQFADRLIKEQIKLHPEIIRGHAAAAKSGGDSMDAPVMISTDNVNKVQLKQKLAQIKSLLSKQSKIDQDSGCLDAAYWGFTREEVKASLSDQGINMSSTRRGDEVYTDDRQIENISLFYQDNKLVKLEEVYLISSITAFSSLKMNMAQKYGTPDNVKDIKLVRAIDPVTWTGKYTSGTFLLERDGSGKIVAARLRRLPRNPKQPFGKDVQP